MSGVYFHLKAEFSFWDHWSCHLHPYIMYYGLKTLEPTHMSFNELAPSWFITQTTQTRGQTWSEYTTPGRLDPGGHPSRGRCSGCAQRAALSPHRTRTGNLPPVGCCRSSHCNKRCEGEMQLLSSSGGGMDGASHNPVGCCFRVLTSH